MNNKAEVFDLVRQIARMNRLGDLIDDGLGTDGGGEKYPYHPDGCSDPDAQALYALIDKARSLVKDDGQISSLALKAYREAAIDQYGNEGEVEIDDDAIVSLGDDDGAYVEAWVWVNKEEAGICRECGEPNANNGEGFDGLCGNCANKTEGPDPEDLYGLTEEG